MIFTIDKICRFKFTQKCLNIIVNSAYNFYTINTYHNFPWKYPFRILIKYYFSNKKKTLAYNVSNIFNRLGKVTTLFA